MDFYKIRTDENKKHITISPSFLVAPSKDLMIRGKSFYAVWDEASGLWSTNEYDVAKLVDRELYSYAEHIDSEKPVYVKTMDIFSSGKWIEFKQFTSRIGDNYHDLDSKLIFADTQTKREDYATKKLSYSLQEGSIEAYEKLVSTLYNPDERAKIEWAIGSIVAGDSVDIQKFFVFYGDAGSGKSTILNIIQKLFEGYYTVFNAKELTSSSNVFSADVFRTNPLIAIQHDGDLSRIEDNTKLNSIVSHETIVMNEKFKSAYAYQPHCMLFMATNRPVKITDAKSGVIRRLIDISPSGRRLQPSAYQAAYSQIDFELGAIAYHCLQVYRKMGKNYYSTYRPTDMIYKTDVFFNFVESQFDIFVEQNYTTATQAYAMYKQYCADSNIGNILPFYKFREELKDYFREFQDRSRVDGKQVRSKYVDFLSEKFLYSEGGVVKDDFPPSLVLDSTESLLDDILKDCKAQYTTQMETPKKKWENVTTTLADLNTRQLHYIQVPENHIVIDFDLKDETGAKSADLNLREASKWPPTYAEFSKGGCGIHLHYIFDGDPTQLSRVYSDGIEIKVFTGNSSLRRRLSKCNTTPIAHISSGLPMKEDKKVVNFEGVKNEKILRSMIQKNLKKEYHGATKPSVDFIAKLLTDAYSSGMHFDVSDLQPKVLSFAASSTNHADYCVSVISKLKFKSDEPSEVQETESDDRLVFFDVEVFPNLFLVNWKFEGSDSCVRMINPTPQEIEDILHLKLVGFNCRRYDNHILYARYLGYDNKALFELSQRIVNGGHNCMFGEAYNLSYLDVYEMSAKKQSLKKFEIELGIHHQELGLPWDQPVDESRWVEVAEYCDNDVFATEAVFNDRKADFLAREILADISGLPINATTQQHTAKIIFGDNKHPQKEFVYTDLSEIFPGYIFDHGKSTYRDEEVGEGGYVYAEPGIYTNVALLDIQSMHPKSGEMLNIFGPYTKNYTDLRDARIAIKAGNIDYARTMLGGKLAKWLNDPATFDDLAYALKIAINIVYGMTSAKFDNIFRDPRNIDNIVAKRGALFMIDLKHAVQERGLTVAHIKTDSIKIPNATPEDIQFVMDFGKKYGYIFEHEATYERMCLVNNAVYIARYATAEDCEKEYGYIPKDCKKHSGQWTATGAEFQHPYIFKTLFSKERIEFNDLCETKAVTGSLYLDMNEKNPEEHDYIFIGKVGSFNPICPGKGGGLLMREKDGKYYAVTGTTGYRWKEAEIVKQLDLVHDIDMSYFKKLVDDAVAHISEFGDFEWFVSDEKVYPYETEEEDLPWDTTKLAEFERSIHHE